jgi:hypothetical protein
MKMALYRNLTKGDPLAYGYISFPRGLGPFTRQAFPQGLDFGPISI